jgi:hypothetical protein
MEAEEFVENMFHGESYWCPWRKYVEGQQLCKASGESCSIEGCAPIYWHKLLTGVV